MYRILSYTAVFCLLAGTTVQAQFKSQQKISAGEGGFTGSLDDFDEFGTSTARLGDLNGDGIGDIVVGAPTGGENDRGAVWILFLNRDGTVKAHETIASGTGGFTETLPDNADFGIAITRIGDLDGDGITEMAVGTDTEQLWVLFLKGDGTVKDHQEISAGTGGFTGVLEDGDFFGAALAGPGDLDEDGMPDLAVGAHGDDDGGNAKGAVWLLFFNADGTVGSHQKISTTEGGFTGILEEGDEFGSSVGTPGDIDREGAAELAVGASGTNDFQGAVWVLFLNTDGTVTDQQKISAGEGGFTATIQGGTRFGHAVAGPGDLDADGVPDLAVGNPSGAGAASGQGALWLLLLEVDGAVRTHHRVASGVGGFTDQLEEDARFGSSLGPVDDLDGDGLTDVVVGAPGEDQGGDDRGAVWILFRDQFSRLETAVDSVSGPAGAWGDYDNDGDLDVVLSGHREGQKSTRIYRWDEGSFTDISANLPGIDEGAVAWGDYDRDGDLDLLLAGYAENDENIARIYRNDDDTFSNIRAGLDGGGDGSVAWGDYDNDGDLDLLSTGRSSTGRSARIYRNERGEFTATAGLIGVKHSTAVWADYDGDDDLDVLVAGCAQASCSGGVSRVYRNENGQFTDIEAGLQGVWKSAAAWGDYDSDGDLDILLTGISNGEHITRIYRNTDGEFTDIKAGIEGASGGAVAWGDHDNDGDLDIFLTGETADSEFVTRIYRNDDGAFKEVQTSLSSVEGGSVALGDYDSDGDLDLLLAGTSTGDPTTNVYRNDEGKLNAVPEPPSGLQAATSDTTVTLSWEAAADSETASPGLTYNLRVGTEPGEFDVVAPMSVVDPATGAGKRTEGKRKIVQKGNAEHGTSWTLSLPTGTYYWSVQTVDAGYRGSAFSAEQEFTIVPVGSPASQEIPEVFKLSANYPNPFNPGTTVRYQVPRTDRVTISIYNLRGQKIVTLLDRVHSPGRHTVSWDGRGANGEPVASGPYIYRMRAGSFSKARAMILAK